MPTPFDLDPERARAVRAELLAPFAREDVAAMDAGAFDRLLSHPEAYAAGWCDDEEPEEDDAPYELRDGVAVLPVRGALAQRGSRFWCWSWAGYDTIARDLARALGDTAVRAVVLAIDSPGGVVSGCFDAVRAMRERVVASGKPCVAVADEHCYSAAYALACVADEVVVPGTGGVGSVGVIATMTSYARAYAAAGIDQRVITSGREKGDGHPALPVSAEALQRAQERVAAFGDVFVAWVAERRGVKPEAVRALEAGVRFGDGAVAAGLADRVSTLPAVLAELAARTAPKSAAAGGAPTATTNTTPRPTAMSLLALLGVATEADAALAVTQLTTLRAQVRAATGAETDDAAVGTLQAWKRDAAAAATLRRQADEDRAAAAKRERAALIQRGVDSLKITPAEAAEDGQEGAFLTGMSTDGLRAFVARVGGAVVAQGAKQPAKGAASAAALTEEQRFLAEQLGLDPDAYAKALAASPG